MCHTVKSTDCLKRRQDVFPAPQLTAVYNSRVRESSTLFWHLTALHTWCTDGYKEIFMYTESNE